MADPSLLSPFPGMDPFLEDPAFWPDFHLRFITCWADVLSERLPEPYEARMSERVNLREAEIEILHRSDRSLVAVLELLSPWNKTGDGFWQYRAKRQAILQQQVHLVELDLLLAGQRLPLARPLPAGHYYAFVSRTDRRPNCDVFRWTVRDPLPVLPIPLKPPDEDLHLALAEVFNLAFSRGRYARSLRYGTEPVGPLADVDRAWVMAFAAKH